MPSKANLSIYQGDDYAAAVTVANDGPVDLTGYQAQAQIRKGPADSNPEVVVEIATTILPPNTITLSIPAAQTLTLSGSYLWDLQVVDTKGMVITLLAGAAVATAEVTRENP